MFDNPIEFLPFLSRLSPNRRCKKSDEPDRRVAVAAGQDGRGCCRQVRAPPLPRCSSKISHPLLPASQPNRRRSRLRAEWTSPACRDDKLKPWLHGTARRPHRPLAATRSHFEETIGTRWCVDRRPVAALSGIFMVRYSIEAGLIGEVVCARGLFALALLAMASGRAARRAFDDRRTAIANIPPF